jgi:aspartyl protease family protein
MSAAVDHPDGLLTALGAAARQIWAEVLVQPLLQLALAAMVLAILGGMLRRGLPLFGGLLRGLGNLGLIVALLLAVGRVMHVATGIDAVDRLGSDDAGLTISGGETRAKLAGDGHFWVTGRVGGGRVRFLVDTGATITTLSAPAAEQAGLEADPDAPAIMLTTANGMTRAERTTIPEMRIGTVVVRNLGAVIAPGIGDTNVLGMNFLSKLASWRVEGDVLVLVPHHPRAAPPESGPIDGPDHQAGQ